MPLSDFLANNIRKKNCPTKNGVTLSLVRRECLKGSGGMFRSMDVAFEVIASKYLLPVSDGV